MGLKIQQKIYTDCYAVLGTDFDCGLHRLSDQDTALMARDTGQQEMLTPPRNLIPPMVYPGSRVCQLLIKFALLKGVMRSITVPYRHLFMYIFYSNETVVHECIQLDLKQPTCGPVLTFKNNF